MTSSDIKLAGNWNYPTAMHFGAGRIGDLAELCRDHGINHPLIVTDPGLAKLPMVANIETALQKDGLAVTIFSQIQENPAEQHVQAGIAALCAADADGVVALGGGSALDVGKAIALMAGQTRPIWDFEDVGNNWQRADSAAILPTIAVPTAAGTGSEVGRSSVILNAETHTKIVVFHPKMMPVAVLSDPELTVSLPPKLTAATGMDALAHCLEAYCVSAFHPMADGIAAEGIRLVHDWLPTAVADGANITARANMLVAASMGATAFQKGLGAIHALSHPLSSNFGTHHGLANAVLMPYVLVHNRPVIEDKLTRVAAYAGLADASFDGFLNWVLDLRARFEIPNDLRELGIPEGDLDRLAQAAESDPTAVGNPVLVTKADLVSIYEQAFAGHLT